MFTQLYLNDSFMIRKIIAAAVPAALVAVGMSLATSQPASSQGRGGFVITTQNFQLSSGGGAAPNTTNTNTNQVYPNNRRTGFLDPQGSFQLSSGAGRRGYAQ